MIRRERVESWCRHTSGHVCRVRLIYLVFARSTRRGIGDVRPNRAIYRLVAARSNARQRQIRHGRRTVPLVKYCNPNGLRKRR